MPPKPSLDKQAWLWADTTRPEDITLENVLTAYRLNLKKCTAGGCKRNCKGSPYCLNGMGERVWLKEIDERKWHDIEDPSYERRPEGSFVGLKNLGATCYVNTFLQLWFHNPEVRRAMYLWEDPSESSSDTVDEDWCPTSICGQLQLMFALLQYSNRRYVDPTSFINCLGLNTAEQQDAQEFSKLFLSVLEEALCHHGDPKVKHLIQEQFCGEYAYVTRCSVCDAVSRTPSKFYELDLNIKGNNSVEACIEEFLKVEKLEGDNQYMCERCNQKQNATRAIQLEKLPRVLSLQLLRFVFDRNTGHKKKLNSFIQFSETLDVSKYLNKQEGEVVYDMTAVLIHRGPSAYSGHYVAHIKDMQTEAWYKFNDEEIEKMEGKKLKLGTEDELPGADGDKQNKKSRGSKGAHQSKNAYMLVYTRREAEDTAVNHSWDGVPMEQMLNQKVQAYVMRDNDRLEAYITELINMREQNVQNGRVKQEEVRHIYTLLHVSQGDTFEWLSIDWLSKWLSDPSTAPAISNRKYLCSHGGLDPDKVSKLKCVTSEGAEQLYTRYSGGPKLNQSTLCWSCVRQRCNLIQTKRRVEEDSKFISSTLKANTERVDCYWVGKSSLRSWRRLAMEQSDCGVDTENGLDDQNETDMTDTALDKTHNGDATEPAVEATRHCDMSETGSEKTKPSDTTEMGAGKTGHVNRTESLAEKTQNGNTTTCTPATQDKQSATDEKDDAKTPTEREESEEEEGLGFNEDLVCETHGNLTPYVNCRRLVPTEVWSRLRAHFPSCPEFSMLSEVCLQCQSMSELEQQTRDVNKGLAYEQKSALLNIFLDRNRPSWLNKNVHRVFVTTAKFVEEWRKFIREPCRRSAPTDVCNNILLCPHGGLLHRPDMENNSAYMQNRLYYVWPSEWEIMSKHFQVDTVIEVCRCTEADNTPPTVITTPALCTECCEARIVQEEQDRYQYTDAVIYVRKIARDCQTDRDSKPDPGSEQDDPEFVQSQAGTVKRKKALPEDLDTPLKVPHLQESSVRKSNRHRRMRGEKEVSVSSSSTLKDLKFKIMKLFSVAPFDQNLSLEETLLQDDTASLAALKVAPGSVLLLTADEPVQDPMIIEDLYKVSSCPESGFKGTSLVSDR